MSTLAQAHSYQTITLKAATKAKFRPLYGPCGPGEYHLLDRAVRQLSKNGANIDFEYVTESDDPDQVTVFRKSNSR